MPRLWIIDPSIETPEEQGVARVAERWPGETRLFRPVLDGNGPRPADGYDADAVVLLGSGASVYDEHEWLAELSAWTRPIVDGEVALPLLGVCFGHQLIAHLAGSPVGFMNEARTKRVTVENTRIEPTRLVPDASSLRVVVSHREEVQRVPEGYRRIARRPHSAIDGLEHVERPLFTTQFHPEAAGEFLERARLDPALADARLDEDSRRLLDGFVRQALP